MAYNRTLVRPGWLIYNRLAAHIALGAAAVLFVLLLLLAQVPGIVLGVREAALAAGLSAIGTYVVTGTLLVRRMNRIRKFLRHIRRQEFEALDAPNLERGDELDGLTWQVVRTGRLLEKELQELHKMENYRREFLGNVSHELKTPIFAIQGFAETLLDGAVEDTRVNRKFIDKILRNAARLNHLVQDLSEISRLEAGSQILTQAPFGLARLVGEVVEALEQKAAERQVALRTLVSPNLPAVYADRERIRQVLLNLTDNAIKYNNPGGHVEIRAEQLDDGSQRVFVQDDGIGIAPKDIPRLTERFYRVDKSRSRDQGGTGLGLAIIKHILAAHHRKLMIESAPGRGSTFSFTLPPAPNPPLPFSLRERNQQG